MPGPLKCRTNPASPPASDKCVTSKITVARLGGVSECPTLHLSITSRTSRPFNRLNQRHSLHPATAGVELNVFHCKNFLASSLLSHISVETNLPVDQREGDCGQHWRKPVVLCRASRSSLGYSESLPVLPCSPTGGGICAVSRAPCQTFAQLLSL